jgi:hypothetical protein
MSARYLAPAEVPAHLLRAFPDFHGRKFRAVVAESVELGGAFWDGGSRSVYRAVELATGRVQSAGAGLANPPQFGGPVRVPVVDIPPGWAIVEHETFRGTSGGLVFYIRPENAAALLTAPTGAELSRDALTVLEVTTGIKSAFRRQVAGRDYGCGAAAYDSGLAELRALGYVNKQGAVTVAGRNIREGFGFNGLQRKLRAIAEGEPCAD